MTAIPRSCLQASDQQTVHFQETWILQEQAPVLQEQLYEDLCEQTIVFNNLHCMLNRQQTTQYTGSIHTLH
jgi:hypothetical protein